MKDRPWQESLNRDGYVLLRQIYSADEIAAILTAWTQAVATAPDRSGALRSQAGVVYAARNLLEIFPAVKEIWRQSALVSVLSETLGAGFGLVRALYFDKPPQHSWSLPWHKDLTIAVARNDLPSDSFRNPTFKAGVPHVEASESLLQRMLTLRIHLDAATGENGPLNVIRGSHQTGKTNAEAQDAICTILAEPGDVLAMRPLLSHSSGGAQAGTALHRRILHLEFAPAGTLPDGYQWRWFKS